MKGSMLLARCGYGMEIREEDWRVKYRHGLLTAETRSLRQAVLNNNNALELVICKCVNSPNCLLDLLLIT